VFGVFRKKEHGIVDDDTRWRVRQVAPHIRRAVLIGRAIERKTAEAATFADTVRPRSRHRRHRLRPASCPTLRSTSVAPRDAYCGSIFAAFTSLPHFS
jgi:hypothetical protein